MSQNAKFPLWRQIEQLSRSAVSCDTSHLLCSYITCALLNLSQINVFTDFEWLTQMFKQIKAVIWNRSVESRLHSESVSIDRSLTTVGYIPCVCRKRLKIQKYQGEYFLILYLVGLTFTTCVSMAARWCTDTFPSGIYGIYFCDGSLPNLSKRHEKTRVFRKKTPFVNLVPYKRPFLEMLNVVVSTYRPSSQ
jgi:hypothetical protein